MNKLTILALSSILLLSGCFLIPPISVEDPLQLDGTNVEITTQRLASTAIGALASEGSGSVSVTFADASEEESNLPFGLNVTRFFNEFSIAPTVTVSKPDDGFPSAFTISKMSLSVELSDVTNPSVTVGSDFGGQITFTRNGDCDVATAETCGYTVSGGLDLNQALFVIAIQSAARAREVVDILTTGGENTVEASVSFTTESTPELAGGAITIELRSLRAEVRVG